MYRLFPSQINYLERDLSIVTATVYVEHAILKQQPATFTLIRNLM